MAIDSFEKLFVDELKDLYNAENQIVKALPRMVRAASSPELQNALKEHLEITKEQVRRLEGIFTDLGKNPKGKKCLGMQGLLDEGKELMSEEVKKEILDAGLIAAAQKVEHYEISGYGTARAFAEMLGFDRAADLLQRTLEEEKEADAKLNSLAETAINRRAEVHSEEQPEHSGDGRA